VRGQDADAGGKDQIGQLRENLDPRAVARRIAERRAAAAGKDFEGSDQAKAMRERLAKEGLADPDIGRRVRAARGRIERDALGAGFRDASTGGASREETLGAQNELIAGQIKSAVSTGKLSDVVAQGLVRAAQEAISASNKAEEALKIAERVNEALGQSTPSNRANRGAR
jgi:hypothetical protein